MIILGDRFWSKVDILGEDECWSWLAFKNPKGYGMFKYEGTVHLAHRLSFAEYNDLCLQDVPEAVIHSCDNPPCINPKHLREGTYILNNEDRDTKNRQSKGSHRPQSKLTEEDIPKIRELLNMGITHRKIASMFGVASPQITNINTGKAWCHV